MQPGRRREFHTQILEKMAMPDFLPRLLAARTEVVGKENKMVTCHIVRTDCMIQANYGALRGNDVQADYVRKPYLHELVYILEGLRDHYSKEKTVETVLRFGKVLEFGHDDITALKKLGICVEFSEEHDYYWPGAPLELKPTP